MFKTISIQVILLFSLYSSILISYPAHTDSEKQITKQIDSLISNEIELLHQDIVNKCDSLNTTVSRIDGNTNGTFIESLIESIFLQKIYDLFFAGKSNEGFLPFLSAICGILFTILRIIFLFYNKKPSLRFETTSLIFLFVVSLFLGLVSNQRFSTTEKVGSVKNSILELKDEIIILNKTIKENVNKKSAVDTSVLSIQSTNKIIDEINQTKNIIKEKIDAKSNTGIVDLLTVFLTIILLILFIKNRYNNV